MSINTVELGPKTQSKLDKISGQLCRVEGSVINIPSAVQRIPNREVITAGTTGSISPGYRSFTVTNIGMTDVLLDGSVLSTGRSNSFSVGDNDTLGGMEYDTQASSIEILTIL